jgi:hypothetical protein
MPGLVLTIGPTVSRSFSDAQAGGSDDTSRAAAACRAPVRRLWPASLDRLCMRSPGSWPASARPGEGQQVMPAHLPKQHRPCQQSAVALGGRERHRVEQLHVGRICGGSVIREASRSSVPSRSIPGAASLPAAAAGTAGGKNVRNGSFSRREVPACGQHAIGPACGNQASFVDRLHIDPLILRHYASPGSWRTFRARHGILAWAAGRYFESAAPGPAAASAKCRGCCKGSGDVCAPPMTARRLATVRRAPAWRAGNPV